MINKTLLFISTMVLALSPFVTVNTWAESHEPKAEETEAECVTQKAYDAMSAEDKEKMSADVCEGDEGEDKSEEPATKAEDGSAPKAETTETAETAETAETEVEESKDNCIPEETFKALSAEDKEKMLGDRCEGSE